MRRRTVLVLLVMLSGGLCGCGYRLGSLDNPLLDGIQTIAIPYFQNKTFEPEIEAIFTHAFIDEFVESRRLDVVPPELADAVLYATIKELDEEAIAYDRHDKSLEYRVWVTLNISLERRKDGEVLWKRSGLKHGEEYRVNQDNIVLSETSKRASLTALARDVAERVHDSIVQGF